MDLSKFSRIVTTYFPRLFWIFGSRGDYECEQDQEMSKSKQVKNKAHGKAVRRPRPAKAACKDKTPAARPVCEAEAREQTATPAAPVADLFQPVAAPLLVDGRVLVLWDDGSQGVCHFIDCEELQIVDGSPGFGRGTRVSFLFNGAPWTGHIPTSVSELIERCCADAAVVDVNAGHERQVLVLWDNPSAGACHFMYTRDLRIADGSPRFRRGTRVITKLRNIDWTGQVPPAIYPAPGDPAAQPDAADQFRAIQQLLDCWLPAEERKKVEERRKAEDAAASEDYAVADGFWRHLNKFCRHISEDDVHYVEGRLLSYHNRYRMRSNLVLRRARDGGENGRCSVGEVSGADCFEFISQRMAPDAGLGNLLVAGPSGDRGAELTQLNIDVMETDSSPASCGTLASGSDSGHSSVAGATSTAQPAHRPRSDSKEAREPLATAEAKAQYILRRLQSPDHDGLLGKLTDGVVERCRRKYPVVSSAVEEFVLSEEPLAIDTEACGPEDGAGDEVLEAIRRKQAELMAVESKNASALRQVQRKMRLSLMRQEIEDRLTDVSLKIALLTGDLMRILRLKYRSRGPYKGRLRQYRAKARSLLERRKLILKELTSFDSKCSPEIVTLYD